MQFAAVAIGASHAATAKLFRARHWTIPVAYDSDGAVGALYGVAVCPMAELAYRGGIVKARLIGDQWQTSAALAPQVGRCATVRASCEVSRATSGFVEPRVAGEFPGLRLRWVTVPARRRRSPRELVRRLRRAVEPLPRRQRGRDADQADPARLPGVLPPDRARSGRAAGSRARQLAVARLMQGGFRSVDVIADACLVALIETGVPVWALDAAVDEWAGDPHDHGRRLRAGVRARGVVDAREPRGRRRGGIHALLFGDPASADRVARPTERVALFAVGVDGVPAIHLEEALWICVDLLT